MRPNLDKTGKLGWLQMQRVQIGGGLLLGVVLPFLLRSWIGPEADDRIMVAAITGCVGAVLLGHAMFRNLTSFPGIGGGGYLLPSFVISYGLMVIAFWGLRQDYSRFIAVTSFLLCLFWYALVFLHRHRGTSLRIGVVPYGQVERLYAIDRVDWVKLSAPDAASIDARIIVADFRFDLPDEWERFLADCALRGMPVYHYKQLRESLTGRVEIDHLSENVFGSLIPASVYVKTKRIIDLATAAPALILLMPLFLVIAVAIKLDSPGPILFRQRRVGTAGRAFRVNKFRTMSHDPRRAAPGQLQDAITLAGDPRITRLGRFLRRTRIDELPQVVNILLGDMSWIGPRPEAEILSEWYERELPFYRYRHIVKPGITGWAQVNQGHVAEVGDVLLKLHYDFFYIKNFSPWLDMLIAFRTLAVVITGRGSR
jgi:lipopolysaccharide/colanic/teichoic acid biosynthesis glycosyltransferase